MKDATLGRRVASKRLNNIDSQSSSSTESWTVRIVTESQGLLIQVFLREDYLRSESQTLYCVEMASSFPYMRIIL